MIVGISASSADIKQQVNPVFGRCPGYIIIELNGPKIKKLEYVVNEATNSPSGAGVAAAQTIIKNKVEALISGNIGPNAFMILQQNGVKIYTAYNITIKEAVKMLTEGKLKESGNASIESKFGMGQGKA